MAPATVWTAAVGFLSSAEGRWLTPEPIWVDVTGWAELWALGWIANV